MALGSRLRKDFGQSVHGPPPCFSFIAMNKEKSSNQYDSLAKKVLNTYGEAEALSFVRNIGAHLNRQHEYLKITVPINEANLQNELLEFITVQDQIITNGRARRAWIVERKINTKNHKIEYFLTVG